MPDSHTTLSPVRQLVHACIFADPASTEAQRAAVDFHAYLEQEYAKAQAQANPDDRVCAIFAAGLLTYGRLDLLDTILATIPEHPTPGQTGYALTLGSTVINHVLPLPPNVRPPHPWRSHLAVQPVRDWVQEHREHLQWDSIREQFVLAPLT